MRGKNKKAALEHLMIVYHEAKDMMDFEKLDALVKEKFDHDLSLLKASDYQRFIDVNADYDERLEREMAYAHKCAKKDYLHIFEDEEDYHNPYSDLVALGFSNPNAKIEDFKNDYNTILDLVEEYTKN